MSDPPTIPYASPAPQLTADSGHLTALSICHYVWGALALLFSCVFVIYIVMGVLFVNGKIPVAAPPGGPRPPPVPTEMGYVFIGVGSGLLALGWTLGILTIISGLCIARRRRRIFSMVVAGLNCASFPFGTVLGVFTFVVLARPSVRGMYVR